MDHPTQCSTTLSAVAKVVLGGALALGVLTTWARGDCIFGLFRLPKPNLADPDLGH